MKGISCMYFSFLILFFLIEKNIDSIKTIPVSVAGVPGYVSAPGVGVSHPRAF